MRCSAGLCRDTKPKSPQRHGRKIRLPRQRVRIDATTSHPSGSTGSAISSEPVGLAQQAMVGGGGGTQCRSPVLSPRRTGERQPPDPSRRTQPTRTPADSWLVMQGTKVPEHRGGYLRKKTGPRVGALAHENETTTNPQASEKHQRQEHCRQKHQRQARRATATSRQKKGLGVRPDIPPTRELECDARGHSEARTQLSILPVLGSVACQCDLTSPVLVGLSAPRR